MDRDDRILAIVLPAEHLLRLAGVYLAGEFVERAAEIVGNRLAGFGPFHQHVEIVQASAERRAQLAILFEPAAPLHDLLRLGLIFPEVRSGDAFFYFCEFDFGAGGVKDGSAGPWRGAPDPRTCEADRPVAKPMGRLL
jgi:hypothetical protein